MKTEKRFHRFTMMGGVLKADVNATHRKCGGVASAKQPQLIDERKVGVPDTAADVEAIPAIHKNKLIEQPVRLPLCSGD
jgi:hypothetical protein